MKIKNNSKLLAQVLLNLQLLEAAEWLDKVEQD